MGKIQDVNTQERRYRMIYQTTIQVEAIQWTGDNFGEISKFIEYPEDKTKDTEFLILDGNKLEISIFLRDGGFKTVEMGDWIIRDDRPQNAHFLSVYTNETFRVKFHRVTQNLL